MHNISKRLFLASPIPAILFPGLLSPTYAATNDTAMSSPDWQTVAAAARETQPHWESLLNMSSPRLTQGLRYNYVQQQLPGNTRLSSNGFKALEFIATDSLEVQIGPPAHVDKQTPNTNLSGWSDGSLLGKYRIAAGNEENGNYILSASLGLSLPTGSTPFSSGAAVYAPTIAAGKGWGTRQHGLDIQSSLTANVPGSNRAVLGIPLIWNTALQAHLYQYLWPEIEVGYTHWHQGSHDGKNQLILTYGVVLGRFDLSRREKLTVGIGYQEPRMTDYASYIRGWLVTAKLSF